MECGFRSSSQAVKYQVTVRRSAERDLEEARDWYNEQQPGLGTEFLDMASELFGRLERIPKSTREFMVRSIERCCGDSRSFCTS